MSAPKMPLMQISADDILEMTGLRPDARELAEIVDKLRDDYCEQLYESSVKIIARHVIDPHRKPKAGDLIGQRIQAVQTLTAEQAKWMFWPEDDLPLGLVLENGLLLLPARDTEGNGPGCWMAIQGDDLITYA